jgi:hypothetical protein
VFVVIMIFLLTDPVLQVSLVFDHPHLHSSLVSAWYLEGLFSCCLSYSGVHNCYCCQGKGAYAFKSALIINQRLCSLWY